MTMPTEALHLASASSPRSDVVLQFGSEETTASGSANCSFKKLAKHTFWFGGVA